MALGKQTAGFRDPNAALPKPNRNNSTRPDRQAPGFLSGPMSLAPSVKRATRVALVAASRPSHQARMLPSFLIVGAARCGTTSMFRALAGHPAVFGPALQKELHYFSNKYFRGIAWYQSHFPLRARARLMARSANVAPQAFESSPYYMFHPLAAERIYRDLPGVKLLVLVRDPVERARSQYSYSVSLGYETESFERALELETSRLEGEYERLASDPSYASHEHRHHSYRVRGQYAEQLERLEKLFGSERIHVVDSDDFFVDPEPVYGGVLEFLGLPPANSPAFLRHNARPRSSVPASVRAALEDHYRPYDERLTRWLGREPSWRRTPD
jgi:Sulfotransferase domain